MKFLYLIISLNVLLCSACYAQTLSQDQVLSDIKNKDIHLYEEIVKIIDKNLLFKADIQQRMEPENLNEAELAYIMFRAAQVCDFNERKVRSEFPVICKISNFIGIVSYLKDSQVYHRVFSFCTINGGDMNVVEEDPKNIGYFETKNWNFGSELCDYRDNPNRLFIREHEGSNYLVATYYITPRGVDNSCPQKYIYLIEFKADTVELKDTKVITLQPGHYPKGLGCHTDDPHEEEDYWGHRPEFYQEAKR